MNEEGGRERPKRVLVAEPNAADMILVLSEWTDEENKTVVLAICDDGEILEVAATYKDVGTRVMYQGQLVTAATRIYNDLRDAVADSGFAGDGPVIRGMDLSDAITEHRAKNARSRRLLSRSWRVESASAL